MLCMICIMYQEWPWWLGLLWSCLSTASHHPLTIHTEKILSLYWKLFHNIIILLEMATWMIFLDNTIQGKDKTICHAMIWSFCIEDPLLVIWYYFIRQIIWSHEKDDFLPVLPDDPWYHNFAMVPWYYMITCLHDCMITWLHGYIITWYLMKRMILTWGSPLQLFKHQIRQTHLEI